MNTITSEPARTIEVKIDPLLQDQCHCCKRKFVLRRSRVYRDRDGNMICSFVCLKKMFDAHNPAGG